jgi:uncharacterized protein (TIGR02099 family)
VNSTTKRLLRAIEVLGWVVFFAFALLVLALRFWILPDIERYREDIVAALSRGIGLPVKVRSIEAGWLGLRPQITLSDVRIHDAQGRETLVLPSIHNVVAWRSIAAGELRLHRLVIEGPRLAVRRDAAGQIYVAGLKLAPGAARGNAATGPAALLARGEVVIRNAEIEWRDELRGAPPLVLHDVELALASSPGTHAVGLKARTAPELGGSFELSVRVDGDELPPGAWNGRAFLQVGYTDLNAWRPWVDYPLNLREGQGALRAWASIEGGSVKGGTADVMLSGVRASLADELSPLELATVGGRVHLRALADGVEFSGRGLSVVLASGPAIPRTDFEIVWRPQAGGTLAASLVDLEAMRHVAGSLPLPPQLTAALDELAPRGRLADARLEWTGPFDAPQRYSARARFSDLALRPREGVPGFAGLTGSLEANQERGKLTLASSKTVLELPRVFPQPAIALDSLAGEIGWELDKPRGFTVRVASLSFANAHASGNLFGSYTRADDGPGSLDLSAVLNRADARHVERYLPHAEMMGGPKLRGWLAEAIVAGEASDVRVRVRGDLRRFPFIDPAEGQFQVTARFEKGVLDYQKGWPRIDAVSGELNFERDRMEVVGRSGSVLGAQLSDVRAGISSLSSPARRLTVSGQADGPTGAFLAYVQSSPVREKAGAAVAGMRTAGSGRLRLKLDMPLADAARTTVEGEYDFSANQVQVVSWLPPVDAAAGRLAFTNGGFTLHNVRGRFLGGALSVAGGTRPGSGVEVVARGSNASFEATRAIAFLDHPVREYLSGTFAFAATVREHEGQARVSFESPLRGIESRLPAPLAKRAAEALPLRVEVTPSARGERDRIAVSFGSLARAELSRRRAGDAPGDAMEVQRTAVWLSPQRGQPIRLPERPGTLVYGALPEFDFDGWRPLLLGGDERPGSQAISLDLKFGALDAYGKRFHNVATRGSAAATGWSASVQADELAGDLSYRAGASPRVVGRLSHLTIPVDAPRMGAGSRGAARPADLPAVDLVAEDFTFRGNQLGRLELAASRAGDDWRVDGMKMENPDAAVSVRGLWSGAPSRTAMNFDLQAANVGAFLARVGYPGLVRGGKAQMGGSLTWQGDPGAVDFPSLAGDVHMEAQDGQFLEIEPGIGKLISLMSLQALPRRITLDFRDVFSKGFQFDRIDSNAQVEKGVIGLKQFRMRGSAADVAMTGEADLAHETQNLRVRVVPSLGDSAALGLTLVNPVAGVAAAIAQRILKDPLGQIFAFDYAVTGSWADPKVAKIPQPPAQVSEPVNQ